MNARQFFWLLVVMDAIIGLLVFGAIAASLCLGGSPGILGAVYNQEYLLICLAAATVMAANGSLNAGFAVTGQLTRLAKTRLTISVLTFITTLTSLAVGGAIPFLIAGLVTSLLGTAILVSQVSRLVPVSLPSSRRGAKELLPIGWFRFTLTSSIATTLASGGESATVTVAGVGGGDSVVVLLKIAQAPARFIVSVFSPVAAQVFPRSAERYARGDMDGIIALCRRTTLATVGPAVLAVSGAALILPFAIPLMYGDEFSYITLAATFFVIGSGIRVLVIWSKVLPLAIGRSELRLATLGVETLATLVCTWLLVTTESPKVAVEGVAITSIAVALAMALFWWLFLNRLRRSRR